jgi:hypothetical protein
MGLAEHTVSGAEKATGDAILLAGLFHPRAPRAQCWG